jgi:hypothetical protein
MSYNNYETNKRIDTIQNFIIANPTNISFLWNQDHYINSIDEYNIISGQLILEYCENKTWRPLTYTTYLDDVYCYILNSHNEIQEFISSYEYVDSLIQTQESEASEDEFTTFTDQHFGKTTDQIVFEISQNTYVIENSNEKYKSKHSKHYKHSKLSKSKNFKNKLFEALTHTYKAPELALDNSEKTDDDDVLQQK